MRLKEDTKFTLTIKQLRQLVAEAKVDALVADICAEVDSLPTDEREVAIAFLEKVAAGEVDVADGKRMAQDMEADVDRVEDASLDAEGRVDEDFKTTLKKITKALGRGTLFFLELIGKSVLWLLGHPQVLLSIGSIVAMLYGYSQIRTLLGGAASIAKAVLGRLRDVPKNAKELLPPVSSPTGPEMPHIGAPEWSQMVTPGGMDSFQQMALGI